jgi:hypothetical protein
MACFNDCSYYSRLIGSVEESKKSNFYRKDAKDAEKTLIRNLSFFALSISYPTQGKRLTIDDQVFPMKKILIFQKAHE